MVASNGRAERLMALLGGLSSGSPGASPSPDASLGELGLDSLSFAELAGVVEEDLGVDLGGIAVDERTTVTELAGAVEAAPELDPRGDRVPPGIGRLQGASKLLGGWPLRWWLALRVTGSEHVPSSGPAILAMNHESAMDIPLFVVASPRRITFMAKRELFRNAFVSRSLHELGGFQVRRERFDLPAIRIALAALERGDLLGMYPEGTRAPGRLLPFLRGAAWMALRTGAPLVPAAIAGTEHAHRALAPRRVRVSVAFGPPIPVEPVKDGSVRRAASVALTEELRTRIEALLGMRPRPLS